MRYLTPCIAAIISIGFYCNAAFSQSCADCRYISPVFDSVKITTVKFGQGPRFNGNIQELYMDIYEPVGDTAANRPVAVFAFGGAFITGSRDDWYVILACEEIAKSGYVVASIDYRIYDDLTGLIAEIGLGQHPRIFFRPMQDMRAAVQYLKADYAELGDNYRIDTSRILIGGASSGAMTSLMTAYCDKESEMAEMGITGTTASLDALGGFYSTSSIHYSNYSWKALATFNVAGSLVNADWIEPGDVPIILAHGDADNVVPYKSGGFIPPFFDMQGSYTVDSVARAKGVCSYLYTMEGQDHPNDDMGIEYLKSVVYRMMLRMHAVISGRSFCCDLDVKVNPVDTVYYEENGDPVCLNACADKSYGNAQIKWCGINCLPSEGSSSVLTIEPDTNMKYITCMAYEGQCQAVSLNMVKPGTPVACDTPACEILSGLPALDDNAIVRVYPQPASGAFTLVAEFSNHLNELVIIEVFNITGKKIFSKEFFADNGLNETIDVHDLSAGSYLLSLSTATLRQHQKLLITNY